jgi:hypothetical protein
MELTKLHRDRLRVISSEYPSGRKVNDSKKKTTSDLKAWGLIEVVPEGDKPYAYYQITEMGLQAVKSPTAKKPRTPRRLVAMPSRLTPLPPRIATFKS